MLWLGHLALGYLVTKLLLFVAPITFSLQEQHMLIAVGMIASILPDLDFIPFWIKNRSLKFRKDESHRKIWSHAPLLWALIVLAFLVFSSPSHLTAFAGLIFLAGSWSHFLGDSIEYGVFWLWPFSQRQFCIHKIRGKEPSPQGISTARYYGKFFTQVYIRNWTFWVEAALVIAALAVAL